jgi:putative copper export protein
VFTIENLFHFLHQLAAIVWVGGVLALNVLQVRLGRGQDRAAVVSLLRHADLYGRAVVAPAAVITLLTGIVLVAQMDDVAWTDLWVVWGTAGILLSVALGGTLIRMTNAELQRLATDARVAPGMSSAPDSPDATAATADGTQWRARQRRAATLYTINVLLLLSSVWAMIFKPTL